MLDSRKILLAGSLTTSRVYSQMVADITETHRPCFAYNRKFWRRTLHGSMTTRPTMTSCGVSRNQQLKKQSGKWSMPTNQKLSNGPFQEFLDVTKKWVLTKPKHFNEFGRASS
ncbi:uncharacterized protein EURHEDRAFT_80048 [Aspergillus ruber CBS 135680]|uniref:Uncharacterized protein n=1 Tax=Aspergillus ruber (strain CBS 135680) TaxID=1388766 RepID=A0A017SEF6_ASPRC|nr:uncharacterized protein EURHEDRAFT_80048 [Aspergillus ruber CBS 135680]EYE94605.1 hypothetical protein EURHEDRAFT_80048 [Aspergillus ruber CBS 135680]